jgi:hypothetical protein
MALMRRHAHRQRHISRSPEATKVEKFTPCTDSKIGHQNQLPDIIPLLGPTLAGDLCPPLDHLTKDNPVLLHIPIHIATAIILGC